MCTNPITIKRYYPSIGKRSFVVPCGKCEECVRKKQVEFGALALHQGLKSDSVYFVTFTYRNEMCPVAISEDTPEGPRIIGFERGCNSWVNADGVFTNAVISQHFTNPQVYACCSLCREDIKLCIKQFRSDWKKAYPDTPIALKYAVFGEVGEQRGRPHYHGLFFGLLPAQIKMLTDIWNRRFGFTYTIPPALNRKLSLDEIKKVSAYTSKYISKGIYTRWQHVLPYMEKPRRQSSINFGDFSESELSALCDFTFVAICFHPVPDCLPLMFWTASYLDGKVSKLPVKNFLSPNA